MIPTELWTYRASWRNVVDGDTIDVDIDAGFRNSRTERLRLLGVNAPEMKTTTLVAARAAKLFVQEWLVLADLDGQSEYSLIVQTHKSDVFGRFLATIWRVSDGACLNIDLLEAGHARVDIRP